MLDGGNEENDYEFEITSKCSEVLYLLDTDRDVYHLQYLKSVLLDEQQPDQYLASDLCGPADRLR